LLDLIATANARLLLLPGVFLEKTPMNDAQILTLVDRFERCLLAKNEFHHRDHLAVAVVYLYASDFPSAMDRMRASLQRFAAHHGVLGLYHETLTRFWLQQVEERLDRGACLTESVEKMQRELGDKGVVSRYYSKQLLDSLEARDRWVEPDQCRSSQPVQ
jgi:hypothetical protein